MWSVTFAYLSGFPDTITTEHDGNDYHTPAQIELQRLADAKRLRSDRPPIGPLQFEAYTDELHAFFVRNGKRVRFANLQVEETWE